MYHHSARKCREGASQKPSSTQSTSKVSPSTRIIGMPQQPLALWKSVLQQISQLPAQNSALQRVSAGKIVNLVDSFHDCSIVSRAIWKELLKLEVRKCSLAPPGKCRVIRHLRHIQQQCPCSVIISNLHSAARM